MRTCSLIRSETGSYIGLRSSDDRREEVPETSKGFSTADLYWALSMKTPPVQPVPLARFASIAESRLIKHAPDSICD